MVPAVGSEDPAVLEREATAFVVQLVIVVGFAEQQGVGQFGDAGVAEQAAVMGDEPVSGGGPSCPAGAGAAGTALDLAESRLRGHLNVAA